MIEEVEELVDQPEKEEKEESSEPSSLTDKSIVKIIKTVQEAVKEAVYKDSIVTGSLRFINLFCELNFFHICLMDKKLTLH